MLQFPQRQSNFRLVSSHKIAERNAKINIKTAKMECPKTIIFVGPQVSDI
jgi:hypothetical protein